MDDKHVIGIVGGAVAGSEAARMAAERGALVVVFEQNTRPYGKIEDGLPRWHVALRQKEYGRIDDNLDHHNIRFVPQTRLGTDLSWETLTRSLGLSLVVMANGAWRDRAITSADMAAYVDRGLVYQNPFVYWFNHHPEPGYDGPAYEVPDGAIVIGGGLASIDVVKIVNLELYAGALAARGHAVDVVAMEHRGIPATVEACGLTVEELGITGVTLFYRRRAEDMPLASIEKARIKILDKVRRKFLVRFEPQAVAHAPIAGDDGRMAGVVFRRTRLDGRAVIPIEGSEFEVRSDLVVSSIGSIPELLEGVPARGELYDFKSWDTGELDEDAKVYGLGNVLTGKGNIKESRKNARAVIAPLLDQALASAPLDGAALARLEATVRQRWEAVGYGGSYRTWIEAHRPWDWVAS